MSSFIRRPRGSKPSDPKSNKQNGLFTSASTICYPPPRPITANMKGAISSHQSRYTLRKNTRVRIPRDRTRLELRPSSTHTNQNHFNLVSSAEQIMGGNNPPVVRHFAGPTRLAYNRGSSSAEPYSRYNNRFRFLLLVGKNYW